MTAANNIIHKSSHNPKNTYLIVVIFTLWFCTYVPTTWKYCTLTRALLVVCYVFWKVVVAPMIECS